jgi:hypothetical protein
MIDVIVPVYRGHEQTRRCLDSVLANCDVRAVEVVVVDDASPEPALAEYLDALSRSGSITLLKNETNRGFVESVNRGMSLHRDRDVVLLNSDTEVAAGWLERLAACAYREPDIGTVTPFSNNATICSYPFDGWAGGVPGTLGLSRLDRLIATTNAGRHIELPTAVGFCMYIRERLSMPSGISTSNASVAAMARKTISRCAPVPRDGAAYLPRTYSYSIRAASVSARNAPGCSAPACNACWKRIPDISTLSGTSPVAIRLPACGVPLTTPDTRSVATNGIPSFASSVRDGALRPECPVRCSCISRTAGMAAPTAGSRISVRTILSGAIWFCVRLAIAILQRGA